MLIYMDQCSTRFVRLIGCSTALMHNFAIVQYRIFDVRLLWFTLQKLTGGSFSLYVRSRLWFTV